MAWVPVTGSDNFEFDDSPPDPGGAQTALWDLQFEGVRVNVYDGTEVYTRCRRVGETVVIGEINKTYYDNLFYDDNEVTEMDWDGLTWLNLDWLI